MCDLKESVNGAHIETMFVLTAYCSGAAVEDVSGVDAIKRGPSRADVNLIFPAHHLLLPFAQVQLYWLEVPPANVIGCHLQLKPALCPCCHTTSEKVSETSASHIPVACPLPLFPSITKLWAKQ